MECEGPGIEGEAVDSLEGAGSRAVALARNQGDRTEPIAQLVEESAVPAAVLEPGGQAEESFFALAAQDDDAPVEGGEGFSLDLGITAGDEDDGDGIGRKGGSNYPPRFLLGLARYGAGIDDDEIRAFSVGVVREELRAAAREGVGEGLGLQLIELAAEGVKGYPERQWSLAETRAEPSIASWRWGSMARAF